MWQETLKQLSWMPNLQGGSWVGLWIHSCFIKEAHPTHSVLHFPPPTVSTDLISWRPRQRVKAVMEIVRYIGTLKIYNLVSTDQHHSVAFDRLHGCLWALLSHKGNLQAQWLQWLPQWHLYMLDASSENLQCKTFPLSLTRYTSTMPKKQKWNIMKSYVRIL